MSGLLGRGALVNWGGVVAEHEDDYNAWHSLEHMPERLAVPGFRRGRRAIAVEGTPDALKYFMMYEAVEAEVFVSAPYLARLNDPTPWTRRILSAYVAPSRTVCRVLATRGYGAGGWLATVQIGQAEAARLRDWAKGGWIDAVAALPGILGAHALEGDTEFGQQPTAEKRFRESRGEPDRTVALALLIDGMDREPTEHAMAVLAGLLKQEGVESAVATLYRTQHLISNVDVEPRA